MLRWVTVIAGREGRVMLAEMHQSGEGGEHDLERAKDLYRVAVSNRHPEARIRLRRVGVEAP
jgi:TPR repeat protein